ncbi:MAG: SRPBCC domain-containing protein [Anaerolineae bacterium]
MSNKNFTASFSVDQSPEDVFAAINNPRGWWSQAIEGSTDKLQAEFNYHYQNVHHCAFKITEFVPGQKVVWHVVDNYFNFTKDKSEWTGTDVIFEIARKGDKTEVHFTHVGLVPAYECYDVCSNAWGTYITGSLRDLITTGKGNPNPIEEVVSKARQMSDQNYTTSFTVDQSPEEVFAAINNVRGWWSEEIDGRTDKLGAEFDFHSEDLHYSTHKITEFVPGQKVVWHTTDSRINFVKDKTEWTGTDIVFEITKKDNQTELRFTHVGLAPAIECYGDCSDAWDFYVNDSLRSLITSGKGQPAQKEEGGLEKPCL